MVGAKLIEIVQSAPALSDEPQVLVWVNCDDAATPLSVRTPVPVFVSVTVCSELLVPTAWVPKFKLVDDNVPTPSEIPSPWSVATWGEEGSLSTTVMVPLRIPVAEGVNVISNSPQPSDAVKTDGHPFFVNLKSVPSTVTLFTVTLLEP